MLRNNVKTRTILYKIKPARNSAISSLHLIYNNITILHKVYTMQKEHSINSW
jgi:hypothetical protein